MRVAIAMTAVCAVLAVGAGILLRKPGPTEIARGAAAALCARDVDGLLGLTLPEERDRLHLTRGALKGFLDETVWAHTMPRRLLLPTKPNSDADEVTFAAVPDGRAEGLTYPLDIVVTRSPDGQWRLATSNLLLHCCMSTLDAKDAMNYGPLYHRLTDKYGILGIRLNSTGYQMFSDMR